MADLHTCRCAFTTRICRDEVTAEEWATYETLYRLAYNWAERVYDAPDDAEAFACRYAGEEWDNDEPCSFPVAYQCEQDAEAHAEARRQEDQRTAQRAEAKRRDAKWRADRRKAARAAAAV